MRIFGFPIRAHYVLVDAISRFGGANPRLLIELRIVAAREHGGPASANCRIKFRPGVAESHANRGLEYGDDSFGTARLDLSCLSQRGQERRALWRFMGAMPQGVRWLHNAWMQLGKRSMDVAMLLSGSRNARTRKAALAVGGHSSFIWES